MTLATAPLGMISAADLGAYLGGRLSRLGHWEGLALGAGMNARGVIEIIIAMVGLRLGVLGVEAYTILVLVAVVTSMMAPPVLLFSMRRVEQTAEERLRAQEHGIPLRDPAVWGPAASTRDRPATHRRSSCCRYA